MLPINARPMQKITITDHHSGFTSVLQMRKNGNMLVRIFFNKQKESLTFKPYVMKIMFLDSGIAQESPQR